jgi:hypothetical protein
MRILLVVWGLVVGVLSMHVAAQQFDMAAIQKWGQAKVVHYSIVGAYHAQTPLAPGKVSGYASIEVTDRVTVEFDWDVRANAVVGEAHFTNAPSKILSANPGFAKECGPPAVNGPYEHIDVTSIVPGPAGLAVKGTRSYPAAGISSQSPATCKHQPVAASKAEVSEVLAVTSPMMVLMPNGANPNLTVAADKKSYTMKVQGWNWTYTPSIVK